MHKLSVHLEGRVLDGGPDVVDGGVHQGEGPAVQRHPQHRLLPRGAELQEVLQGVAIIIISIVISIIIIITTCRV